MLWVPKKGVLRVEHNLGAVGTLTPGTSCTTGAASSTKGTPAQIFAATAFDAYWVEIFATNYAVNAGASQGAMDILIGAATEEVLIPNLLMGYCGLFAVATSGGWKQWKFPLYIPAGSRIAVQAAGIRLSTAFFVQMMLYGGDGMPPFRVGSKVTTYGMGTVPDGTTIVPGASAAEGSWTQMTAATTEDHFAFFPSFQISGDTSTLARGYALDIGVGAATEEMIGEGYTYHVDAGEVVNGPYGVTMPAFADVPSGSRLVMRVSGSGTLDTTYNGVLHAVS